MVQLTTTLPFPGRRIGWPTAGGLPIGVGLGVVGFGVGPGVVGVGFGAGVDVDVAGLGVGPVVGGGAGEVAADEGFGAGAVASGVVPLGATGTGTLVGAPGALGLGAGTGVLCPALLGAVSEGFGAEDG